MEILQTWLLPFFAYSGGVGLTFFLLFQFFGKKWLENKFQQRLDELRHQQNIEVARLRIEIDSMLNGALRLQEKEFEILPKIWELLDKSFYQLLFVTSPNQSYADIDRMKDAQLNEHLERTKFSETEKQSIKESQRKSDLYVKYLTFERITEARDSATDLGSYLSLNGILMPLNLKEKFSVITTSLNTISHQGRALIAHQLPGSIFDSHDKVEELRPLLNEIETMIQMRLASHAKALNV